MIVESNTKFVAILAADMARAVGGELLARQTLNRNQPDDFSNVKIPPSSDPRTYDLPISARRFCLQAAWSDSQSLLQTTNENPKAASFA